MKRARFNPPNGEAFAKALRKRVNLYFKENDIKKTGNWSLYSKTIILFVAYFTPWACILIFSPMPNYIYFPLWMSMGLGMAGIGFSVMHDAVHESYSTNRTLNKYVGEISMFIVGGFAANWRIQHNQLHHTYTNVHELDNDIMPPFLLRFSPDYPKIWLHKFQFLYAWFFYGLLTLSWVGAKDFQQIIRFRKDGFYDNKVKEYRTELVKLVCFKMIYMTLFLVLPTLLTPYSFWMVLAGFLSMHFFAGVMISMVFQPAHVTTTTEFPKVTEDAIIEESWAEIQVKTTQNFAMTNKPLSWYIGGLNFQIEHHLFPNISHVHYKKLSPIVQEVAKEFGLPYLNLPSFRAALLDHSKMLYRLGRE